MYSTPPVRHTDGTPAEMPRTAGEARDVVTRLLAAEFDELSDEILSNVVVADALLVTSEIVTNALRHGGGLTGFSARITDSGLHLVVDDADPRHPVLQDPPPGSVGKGGYGWSLVHRLTRQLSVISHEGGKRIVAVVSLF
ncbi:MULTISPECIES: ATP-binding protein [unclassified Streptomyces]|uniref:ATP-binding protein n=1 Tax=unclassified Streptomyces TaxID=2593676 RepID=UPI0033AFC9E8